MSSRSPDRLTKKDTVALWHAVQAFAALIEAERRMEGIEEEMLDDDKAKLAAARKALLKVNKIREEQRI